MSKLLINEPPLMVMPSLAVALGLNQALILQQIHYWLGVQRDEIDGEKWVYNTIIQWREQFPFFSEDTIYRALKSLRDDGFVVAKNLSNNQFNKTLYYRIDYRKLDDIDYRNLRVSETADCGNLYITETTNRDYTENTKKKSPAAPKFSAKQALIDLGVSDQVASDYLVVRKAKRSPLTETAIVGITREAEKAGLSFADAVGVCASEGWVGFKLAWYQNLKPSTGRQPTMTLLEHNQQSAREALEIIRAGRA